MATASKNWTAQTFIEATATSFTALASVTEEFSTSIDLVTSGYIGAHIMVEVDFDTAPTDDVDVKIYSSQDGTNWDDIPVSSIRVDNGTDPAQLSFVLEGYAYLRVGFVQTGSTDTHSVRGSYRAWNVTIA